MTAALVNLLALAVGLLAGILCVLLVTSMYLRRVWLCVTVIATCVSGVEALGDCTIHRV